MLSASKTGFSYANLAIRGKLLQQIFDEQVDAVLALNPDLISIPAGGNDMIRPGSDPDEIAGRFEDGLVRLRSDSATVLLFTGPDFGMTPVLGGRDTKWPSTTRIFTPSRDDAMQLSLTSGRCGSCGIRECGPLTGCTSPRSATTPSPGWLSTPSNVENELEPHRPEPLPQVSWRQARSEDVVWARVHLVPWVLRRIRHQSSGDNHTAKRPGFDAN